ncbi:6-pyruvoyl-tetrahydropterin synthase [Aquamicrobium terrae]|uniref:6-pyruvoyl-tetrahydropterin synthase n=1 Tax=Aquamicrobium terrae TaxID=1324945 RepID=A0ABV2N2I2_9HYPH
MRLRRRTQRRNFYQLRAEVSHRGHYYHEYCMAISVERESPTYQVMTADAEEVVIEALRDLARWLYRQLDHEYAYLTSDEAVDEVIVANAYTFTEAGRRFG